MVAAFTKSLRATVFLSIVTVVLVASGLQSIAWTLDFLRGLSVNLDEIRTHRIEMQKTRLKSEVHRAQGYLNFVRSLPDLDDSAKQELAAGYLQRVRFGRDDILFGFEPVDDAHCFNRFGAIPAGTNLLESPTLIQATAIRELTSAARSGGGHVYYLFDDALQQQKREKMAYVEHDPTWNWVIGAGVYVPDIEAELQPVVDGAMEELTNALFMAFLAVTGGTLLAVAAAWAISTRLSRNFQLLGEFFDHAAESGRSIALDEIRFDEFKTLSASANATITARRSSERELHRARRQVESILDSLTDAVLAVNQHGVIVGANRRAGVLAGSDKVHCLGKVVGEVFGIHFLNEKSLTPESLLEMVRNPGEQREFSDVVVMPQGRPQRGIFTLTLAPIQLETSGDTAALLILRDVTQERELTEQLLQAQKVDAVGRLAGGIAHDFNNLLTIMLGYAQLTLESLDEHSRNRKNMLQVIDAAKRAQTLTRQLLTFSRKEKSKPALVDLNHVARDTTHMLSRLIGEDIEVRLQTAETPCGALIDRGQFEQALTNLIVNARDAMPGGGTLTVRTWCDDDHTCVAVSDTGVGIDNEILASIFEPFFTTKPRTAGTGLGLAVVKTVVDAAQGTISVSSSANGSEFLLRFPRALNVPVQVEELESSARPGGKESVLVIEDEASLRALMVDTLEGLGYTVFEAEDGESAVSLASRTRTPVQAIVSDVILPGVSGPEAVARILQDQPELPVLYISGYTDQKLEQYGVDVKLKAGRTAFLAKPFKPHELARELRAVIDRTITRH